MIKVVFVRSYFGFGFRLSAFTHIECSLNNPGIVFEHDIKIGNRVADNVASGFPTAT
jgi:hypothetical protein